MSSCAAAEYALFFFLPQINHFFSWEKTPPIIVEVTMTTGQDESSVRVALR